LHSKGCVDLYFGDASHFGTVPNVPYAWQTKGDPVLLPSVRSKSLSVVGLMTPCSKLFRRTFECSVDSRVMSDFLDDFSRTITKKTIVVLDNASIHKSRIFSEKRKEWEKIGLVIHFIPPYSPELNLIEILWRFIKYRWLPFDAYTAQIQVANATNICMNLLSRFSTSHMRNH